MFETRFVTPGDDVYCLLDDPVIGPSCELGNGFITDPEVCGSDSTDRVGRIETFNGKPRPVCNADTIREPGAKVISPAAVVVAGDVTLRGRAVRRDLHRPRGRGGILPRQGRVPRLLTPQLA